VVDSFNNVACRPIVNPDNPENWNPGSVALRDDSYSCIVVMSLNGDTLMDAIIGDAQARNMITLINKGTKNDAWFDTLDQDGQFPSYDVPVRQSYFNCPSYVDIDNDGKKDFIIGHREYENRKLPYYKNNGTNAAPVLSYQNDSLFESGMIDVG